jgi:hypothetical protein
MTTDVKKTDVDGAGAGLRMPASTALCGHDCVSERGKGIPSPAAAVGDEELQVELMLRGWIGVEAHGGTTLKEWMV